MQNDQQLAVASIDSRCARHVLFTSKRDPAKQKAMNEHVENHLVQKIYVNCSIILGSRASG